MKTTGYPDLQEHADVHNRFTEEVQSSSQEEFSKEKGNESSNDTRTRRY